ncbi:MAG TPA: flagellar hook-associated protein FlgL [Myxococcales bacterium]|nr:flagellar hook-associated protein FlgL [Myxococcales bacterium]
MRVSDSMIFNNAALYSDNAQSSVDDATRVASTGIRVQHPGDDPAAAAGIVAHSSALAQAQNLSKVTASANDELSAADGALSQVSDALARARELAVQMSNSTYSAADRAGAAAEVATLSQQVSAALNLKVGTRYVFGGSKDQSAPFDASGNYLGDGTVRQIEIAPGLRQDVSVRTDQVIKGAGGGVDVFAAIGALQSALTANDPDAVRASMDGLTQATGQVAAGRAALGGDMDALTAAKNAADTAAQTETSAVSKLQDADVIDAATKLALAQHALEAALTATSQGFKLSLLDPTGA